MHDLFHRKDFILGKHGQNTMCIDDIGLIDSSCIVNAQVDKVPHNICLYELDYCCSHQRGF